ncbi:ABC transporter ATP-binding protein [Caviibacter abscessus]|uniref:ABC transporter ATP-binding protein n=1 Tax=Caviibacter abscessus TaxID=1766719 RepID=UPI00082B96BA|nr:ABC transporter ATP-binding protein [Caviibacter abscessus]
MQTLLRLENVTKIYKTNVEEIKILDNINMAIEEGDLVSIQGKSGSGKTTLLNILGLLDSDFQGKIYINEKIPENINEAELRSENIGFVFQFHYLLAEFTALENIMLPALERGKYTKKEIEQKAMELLDLVGLENRAKHYPNELSGGEKQRIAIARALINDPQIILADEPTGNLDEYNSKKINDLFLKINKEKKQSIIIVTHSKELADIAKIKYKVENYKLVKFN